MNLEIGDMIEVIDIALGFDDLNRSCELLPGDCGLVVDTTGGPLSFLGVMIASEIVYIPEHCTKKAFG